MRGIWIGLLISLGFLILFCVPAFFFGKNEGYKKGYAACQTIKQGIPIKTDSVIIHDTIKIVKIQKEIAVESYPETCYVAKDITRDPIAHVDSGHCYVLEEIQRGATLKAEICSRSFPAIKPLDLHGLLTYIPGPDTIHNIYRIDTVQCIPIPWYRDGKVYAIAGLVALVGLQSYYNLRQ
jgi:hypothetical protein